MLFAVFQEFRNKDVLEQVNALVPVDVATEACALAKTESEVETVSTNAKLMFPVQTPAEEVDAVLEKLSALGFEVVNRYPVTSAGCAMKDRVILKLKA